ncbi:hypothetical protein Vafri_11858 [Volvox africanus]|uniref:Uncharacterized protein n=1 Tax=Volvox africanus TaxID=51714 RepID=A0A8J4F1U1_9CHLO|nr:hypothetical protein Vafri_11858 [Volvox africanus]
MWRVLPSVRGRTSSYAQMERPCNCPPCNPNHSSTAWRPPPPFSHLTSGHLGGRRRAFETHMHLLCACMRACVMYGGGGGGGDGVLMLWRRRLDNAAGSGVHLTPGGLELDEQVLQFGSAVNLRASASVLFPRQLPLEEGEPPLRLQLHRLSLRSIW